MVRTQAQDYNQVEKIEEDIEGLIPVKEEREVILPCLKVSSFQRCNYSIFEEMEDHGGGSMIRACYSGRVEGMTFND